MTNTTPIVNPGWFYLFDVVEGLDLFLFTIMMISVCTIFGIGFYFLLVEADFEDDDTFSFSIRWFKRCCLIVVIAALLQVAIPNKDTCYKMLVANLVTPANIEIVENGVVEFIEDVAGALSNEHKKTEE